MLENEANIKKLNIAYHWNSKLFLKSNPMQQILA